MQIPGAETTSPQSARREGIQIEKLEPDSFPEGVSAIKRSPLGVDSRNARKDSAYWVERLHLMPHPEGGWYRETYRSTLQVAAVGADASLPRSAATSIYFLLADGQVSTLHRIAYDEVWHYHAGSPLRVAAIHPAGRLQTWLVGLDADAGEEPQCVVPGGCWFGAELAEPGTWALVGCTVAPGFEFADFELGSRDALLAEFPEHAGLITRLTR